MGNNKAIISYSIGISILFLINCNSPNQRKNVKINSPNDSLKIDLIYYDSGLFYLDKEDYKNALYYFNKAVKIIPYNYNYLFCRMQAYLSDSQFNNAQEDIDLLILLDSNDPQLYYAQSVIFSNQKKFNLSIENLNKAILICKNDSKRPKKYISYIYYNRGLIYLKINNYLLAKNDFFNVLEIFEDNKTMIYKDILKCYYKLNQIDSVCFYYKQIKKYNMTIDSVSNSIMKMIDCK